MSAIHIEEGTPTHEKLGDFDHVWTADPSPRLCFMQTPWPFLATKHKDLELPLSIQSRELAIRLRDESSLVYQIVTTEPPSPSCFSQEHKQQLGQFKLYEAFHLLGIWSAKPHPAQAPYSPA
jgi:hypothetical protein